MKRKHTPSLCSHRIWECMVNKGETPQKLADAICKSREAVYKYIRGDSIPYLDDALKIAEHYGVTLDYLCGRGDTNA